MSYVKTAVYVLITAMILSLILTYASLMTIIQTNKDNTERVLRSFVIDNSTQIYDSIKNGNDFTQSIINSYFISRYLADGTLDYADGYLYNRDSKGNYVYRLTTPVITFTENNTLNLTCTYNLLIPINFAGELVTELRIPITVKTRFSLK